MVDGSGFWETVTRFQSEIWGRWERGMREETECEVSDSHVDAKDSVGYVIGKGSKEGDLKFLGYALREVWFCSARSWD